MVFNTEYKKILCSDFLNGKCPLGSSNCNKAHGVRELRSFKNPLYKSQLCTAYEQGGVCQIEDRCLFAHGEAELRNDDISMKTDEMEVASMEEPVAESSRSSGSEKRGGYKSALCMHFAKHGSCHMASKCTFAHGKDDLVNVKMPDTSDPKYKTKLCLRFAQDNFCPSGDYCVFAHGEAELKTTTDENTKRSPLYKSSLCHNFITLGVCPSGRNCAFAHGRYELRPAGFDGDFEAKITENPKWKCSLCKNYIHLGHCNKAHCDFAHGEHELRSETVDAPRVLRSNYKTVMCNNWATNGYCFHEDTCTFAHGDEELQKFSSGGRDVASALKLIRGNVIQTMRKRPTTAMSQPVPSNSQQRNEISINSNENMSMISNLNGIRNIHQQGNHNQMSNNSAAVNSVTTALSQVVTSPEHQLFAEFLEFKKFKEQTEQQQQQQQQHSSPIFNFAQLKQLNKLGGNNSAAAQLLTASTGYPPMKIHSATGKQVAVTELMQHNPSSIGAHHHHHHHHRGGANGQAGGSIMTTGGHYSSGGHQSQRHQQHQTFFSARFGGRQTRGGQSSTYGSSSQQTGYSSTCSSNSSNGGGGRSNHSNSGGGDNNKSINPMIEGFNLPNQRMQPIAAAQQEMDYC